MPRPNAGPSSLLLRGVTLSYLAVMVALPLVVLVDRGDRARASARSATS